VLTDEGVLVSEELSLLVPELSSLPEVSVEVVVGSSLPLDSSAVAAFSC
jgi:hypothetical protein